MPILLEMFIRFFGCGLFAIGGGLATLPFLYSIAEETGWFTAHDISNMIAISESTPGPLGVNMATYVGYHTQGIVGALVAPLSLVLPSVIIIVIVSKILNKFKNSKGVQSALYGLRAASAALIASAGLGVARVALLNGGAGHGEISPAGVFSLVNWKAVMLAAVIYITLKKFKKHPIVYIVAAAAAGVVFKF